ncbi:MAG: TonB-dependent receptor plug [Bacteroidetes bacterium]|nr:MAG: TonB-dependent receptor plug [Bacteroidota bacterium]
MRAFLFRAVAVFVLSVFTLPGIAQQTATIRGTVFNKKTGEPVLFAQVFLKDTKFGVQSDINGFYSLTKVPAGTYTLVSSYLGYKQAFLEVTVKAGQILTQNLNMEEIGQTIGMVEISAEKQAKLENTDNSKFTLDQRQLQIVPSIGGVADIAQSVQVLPGVITTGDQGGQLYIRGGAPIQNKVLLDGMIIYNPFHSIGIYSVFDTDIIKNMDVYTGGFGSEYGGRISSVMDITTRDGNKKRFGGKATVSPFASKLMFEGPIRRSDSLNKHGAITYVVSAKTSYLKQTSKIFYSYVDTAGIPFNFNDFYGKIAFNNPNGSKLNLFGFSFNDKVTRFKGSADLNWYSWGFGSNFQVVPGESTTLIKGNFAYSKYVIGMQEDYFQPRNDTVDGFNLGLNFTYFQRKNVINYGVEVLGYHTNFNFTNVVGRKIEQNDNTTEFAAYLRYKWVSENTKLVIEPGFRHMYYASLSNHSPEPRLAFKYNITENIRLKGAGGIYSQNLISAVSDRDVVNLFYGILSGSDNLPDSLTQQDGSVKLIDHKLQKANHYILGIEFDPTLDSANLHKMTINVEGYLKDFTQLTNLNRNKLYDETDPANSDKPDALKKDFIVETGSAYGIDFLVKYEYDRFYLWTVYSLGYVKRWDGVQEYRPHFDRRHNVNVVSAVKLGKARTLEIDVRWNYGSGFPFTPTSGFYENLTFTNVNTNYTTANGQLGIIYGDINSHQLPDYHRLDISVKKSWKFSDFSALEVSAGATNVYNRKNVFYFDRVTFKRVNQLPVMPSLSANWTF